MRSLIFAVSALLSVVAFAAKLDGIAARVDSDVITIGDVMNELRRNPEAGKRMATADESEMEALYRAALDTLVERRLILKAAAEKKVGLEKNFFPGKLSPFRKQRGEKFPERSLKRMRLIILLKSPADGSTHFVTVSPLLSKRSSFRKIVNFSA